MSRRRQPPPQIVMARIAWAIMTRGEAFRDGAKNMAIVRRFALDLVRAHKAKGSIKTRRLIATGALTSYSGSSKVNRR